MVITTRPGVPGVELVTWRDRAGRSGRCVLASVDLADHRWCQLADVLLCPPRRSWVRTRRDLRVVLAGLPGGMIAAASWGPHRIVAVRDVGEFFFRANGEPLSVAAVWCYAWVVSSGSAESPSAASRSRTCCAWGSRARW